MFEPAALTSILGTGVVGVTRTPMETEGFSDNSLERVTCHGTDRSETVETVYGHLALLASYGHRKSDDSEVEPPFSAVLVDGVHAELESAVLDLGLKVSLRSSMMTIRNCLPGRGWENSK